MGDVSGSSSTEFSISVVEIFFKHLKECSTVGDEKAIYIGKKEASDKDKFYELRQDDKVVVNLLVALSL